MTVAELAASLLAAAAAAITDAPTRRVVTVGYPTDPLQNEQLAVGWVRNFTGLPGQPQEGPDTTCWGPLIAEFQIRLTRCVLTSTNEADTPPATLEAAAVQVMGDAQAVRLALRDWAPFDGAGLQDTWVGGPIGYRPQGFAAGFVLPVHVAT